jgi:hypothetical protein
MDWTPRMPPIPVFRGTYDPPAVRIGQRVFCRVRHKWCRITSFTDAPISWPRGQPLKQKGGGGVVVDATLERAIRTESAESLEHFFGVTGGVVWRWRKAFGILRAGTPGSAARIAGASAKGAAAMKSKEWTVEELDRKSKLSKRLGLKPACRWAVGGWTDEQRALLGTDDDEVIAARVGARRVRSGLNGGAADRGGPRQATQRRDGGSRR